MTRDAATDPLPGDYLDPIRRTPESDPMSADVVSPGVATADFAREHGMTVAQVMRARWPHLYEEV